MSRAFVYVLAALCLLGCTHERRARPPLTHEPIDEAHERPAPEGVSPEDRADVLRAALAWVLDDVRGASASAAKRLGFVVVMRDDLRTEPPDIASVQWMALRIVEALVVEKKHAFVYVVVSEVYRQREAFQIAVALRQIWVGDSGEPMHAPLGGERDGSTLLEFIRTPQGIQLVLSPTGK